MIRRSRKIATGSKRDGCGWDIFLCTVGPARMAYSILPMTWVPCVAVRTEPGKHSRGVWLCCGISAQTRVRIADSEAQGVRLWG